MNPNQSGNPYLEMLQRTGGQGPQTSAPAAGPSAMAQALSQQAGAGPQAPQQPGQPGAGAPQAGTTKILLSAVQALHGFTQQATDQQEVAVVRSMIVILNQLIQRDQMAQAQGGGQPQQPGQPAGAPQAAPQAPQAPAGR